MVAKISVTNTQVEVSHITNSPTQTRETVESTHLQNIIARRLGAATFYRRRRCCPIRVPPRLSSSWTTPGPQLPRLPLVELYGACLRKFAFLTRAEWANLRKYALETARERIAKICVDRQNHTIPVCVTVKISHPPTRIPLHGAKQPRRICEISTHQRTSPASIICIRRTRDDFSPYTGAFPRFIPALSWPQSARPRWRSRR